MVLYEPVVYKALEVLKNSTNREASQKAPQMLAPITDFPLITVNVKWSNLTEE